VPGRLCGLVVVHRPIDPHRRVTPLKRKAGGAFCGPRLALAAMLTVTRSNSRHRWAFTLEELPPKGERDQTYFLATGDTRAA